MCVQSFGQGDEYDELLRKWLRQGGRLGAGEGRTLIGRVWFGEPQDR